MNCPQCGNEIEGDTSFCDGCGANLKEDIPPREKTPDTVLTGRSGKPTPETILPGEGKEHLPASFGRFRVLREVGRGAMGVVYLARDDRIGRNVAIKALRIDEKLPEDEKSEIRQRFEREARAAGMLSHSNIVTVYDVGEEEGTPYIAMEYLEGATLTEIGAEGPLSIPQATSVITQLLSALSYAHGHDVVHRDIKPDNVFLLPDGKAKVADFGIARIASTSSMTIVGQVMGTPGYMSPEQVKGESVGPASDIFSAGVLLYELLTGIPAFSSTSATSIMYKIVHEEPKPPHLINPGVPPNLEAVIAKATAKSPSQRYGSASEMKTDIETGASPRLSPQPVSREGTLLRAEPIQEAIPVSAVAPTPAEVPFLKKRRTLLIAGTAAGALLAAGVAVLLVFLLSGKGVSLKIKSPASGETVSGPTLEVSLEVANPDKVGKVELYIDNTLQKTIESAPFTAQIDSPGSGEHELRVSAYDKGGAELASASRNFTSGEAGEATSGDKEIIESFIQAWKSSWMQHDLNKYLSFYSTTFSSGPVNIPKYRDKSYQQWVQIKTEDFGKQVLPAITVENSLITIKGSNAATVFQSSYVGGNYRDYGTYRLEFTNEGGSWKIISEQWVTGVNPPGPYKLAIQ